MMNANRLVLIAILLAFAITELMYTYVSSSAALVIYLVLMLFFTLLAARAEKPLGDFFASLALVPLLRILSTSLPVSGLDPMLQLALIQTVVIAAGLYLFVSRGLPPGLFYPKASLAWLAFAVLVGAGFGLIESRLIGWPAVESTEGFIRLGLTMLVFVGLGEELLFRGLVLTTAEAVAGRGAGLLFTSVLFGLMHVVWKSFPELLFVTFAGLVFGALFRETRSLYPPIIAHAINNIVLLSITR